MTFPGVTKLMDTLEALSCLAYHDNHVDSRSAKVERPMFQHCGQLVFLCFILHTVLFIGKTPPLRPL